MLLHKRWYSDGEGGILMLLKKMLRDLRRHKGTYLASMVLVLIGIMVYNMFAILHESFEYSIDEYYEAYHFGDGIMKVRSMPRSSVDAIQQMPKIKKVQGRLEKRVRLLDEDSDVIFQLMSYDHEDEARLNDIQLLGGRMPDPRKSEIIMGNYYFEAMELSLGDEVDVIIAGNRQRLTIVGYGRSPEFIYAKKNDNELISDPKSFDLAYMPYTSMSKLFNLNHQINNIAFKLYNSEDFEEVKKELEDRTYKYGLISIRERDEQVSHMTTMQKLEGIGSMTNTMPMMFLFISGIIIYIVLKRVIEQERGQIGVLKAFGYSDGRILRHYISFALLIAIVGGAIGATIGIAAVPGLIASMAVGFNMPFITTGLVEKYIIKSFIMATGFALLSGYAGAKKCMKLEPADAMRPPVSKASKAGLLDLLDGVLRYLDMKTKLALRNIMRNKGRSLFIFFGTCITAALLCFPMSMSRMYDKMLADQFTIVETYDLKMTLQQPMPRQEVIKEIANRQGILRVEPMMHLPVEIHHKWYSKETVIIGMETKSQLYHLYNMEDQEVPLNQEGVMLSHWLAKSLKVQVGDAILLKSPYFKGDQLKEVKVTGIIPQYVGTNGYMNIVGMDSLLDGQNLTSSIMVKGSKEGIDQLSEDYQEVEAIASFDLREKLANKFLEFMHQATMATNMMVFFGFIIGFAVIYVALTISLSERNRELATMLVIGMSPSQVHQVMIIEQVILSFFGILAGIPLGKAMLIGMAETSSTDYFVMPSIVPLKAILFSVVMTVIAIILPHVFGRRKINRIIVTEALNARE